MLAIYRIMEMLTQALEELCFGDCESSCLLQARRELGGQSCGGGSYLSVAKNRIIKELQTGQTVSVPLTAETRGLIDATALARMPAGAVLINAARGGIVDEAAVAAALRSGHLGGAALDVFDREPLDAAAGAPFAGVPNLILTPHIAGVTQESNVRVSAVIAAAVRRHLTQG